MATASRSDHCSDTARPPAQRISGGRFGYHAMSPWLSQLELVSVAILLGLELAVAPFSRRETGGTFAGLARVDDGLTDAKLVV